MTTRGTRKTIEYTGEDLFLRFLFKDSNTTKHWAIYKVEDVNDHKAKPIGIFKATPYTVTTTWSDPVIKI